MTIALAPGLEPISGFRCVRRLGRSNRGETWLTKTEDDVQRVLKWLIDGANLRNARKLTTYRHPFLINWDRFEIHGPDLFLISELADETLDVQFEERKQKGEKGLPEDVLLRHLEELAEVLDYLHVKHLLVHGRLTLSQIGIQHRHVKLLDWGLLQSERLACQDWSLNALQFTGPEVLGGQADPASDLFSLAAIYHYAVTGRLPIEAVTLPEFFQKRASREYEFHLHAEAVREVLNKAMQDDPTSRYPSCLAFLRALVKARETITSPSKPALLMPESPPVAVEAPRQAEPVKVEPAAVDLDLDNDLHIPTVILKSLVAVEAHGDSRHPDSAFLNLNNLAYHSKVQSFGILTPTMVVGLGRHGQQVLHELSQLCHERFEGVQQLPHVRVIAFDTGDLGAKPASLTKEQYFECPIPAEDAIAASCKDTHITSWLPAEQRSRQSTPLPTLGRLAVSLRYPALRKRLQDECKLMLQSEALIQATQITGLTIRQDLAPAFYLVAGLDEGLSSGIIADIAYLLRSVIEEAGWGQGKVFGLFYLPHDEQSEQVKAQAYATLVELNHYTQESRFTAKYTQASEINCSSQPFDVAYFRNLPAQENVATEESIYRKSATWLLRDVASELGSLRQASREATRAFATHSSPWYGHGLTTLGSSHAQIKEALKNKLLGKLIGHWLEPDHDLKQEIRGDGERFLTNNVFSASALLERFQHMLAVMLGREPAQLIEEWIAPLRKGAAARPSLEMLARDIMQKVEQTFGISSGYQNSPALVAVQQEADSIAVDVSSKIGPFVLQYLDKPGMRLGASLQIGKLLLDWLNHHLSDLQENHLEIHQDMIRAERTMTQMMSQEERSFAIMNRQRLVSQIVQDLSDYPSRVLKEDMFARAVHVFQHIKKTLEDCLKKLQPAEKSLRELRENYLATPPADCHLLLDGEKTLDNRVNALLEQFPSDVFIRLDADLTVAMTRFQSNYSDVCMGKGPGFADIMGLIDNSLEECMEGMLPSEDAAEQLLTLPSQSVVEQLRESYRDARPDLMENKRSRQGAFCLLLAPRSDAGQDLLQMAQATLPQIVAAPEGGPGEIVLYRETGCLLPHEIYPQGKSAYEKRSKDRATSPHSRFDITYWHALTSSPPASSMPTPSAFELPG